MFQIKQKHNSDCVIAAVASLLELPYSTERKAWNGTTRYGLTTNDIAWLLRELKHPIKRAYYTRKEVPVEQWLKRNQKARGLASIYTPNGSHAFVIENGVVWDPSPSRKLTTTMKYDLYEFIII